MTMASRRKLSLFSSDVSWNIFRATSIYKSNKDVIIIFRINQALSMMTLTEDQGQRSRSNLKKKGKKPTTGHISEAISPTDFILGTKVQCINAH